MAKQLPSILGGRRRAEPPKALTDAISYALDRTYGPGYSFRVRSGIVDEPKGRSAASKTGRHIMDGYGAADIQIFDPNGRQLRGNDLTPLAQNWVANFGSIGVNRKASDTEPHGWTHLDFVTPDKQSIDQNSAWAYGGWAGGDEQREAILSYKAKRGTWVDGKPSGKLAEGLIAASEELRRTTIRADPDTDRHYANFWGRDPFQKGNTGNLSASLDAAAYLGAAFESNDRVSPVETASDLDFLPMSVPLNSRQVADVQAILAEHGLYTGDIDGIAGPQTEAAAAAFREALGIRGGAAVDVGLARALVGTAAPRTMIPGTLPVSPDLDTQAFDPDQDQVLRLKTASKARRQRPVPIDGITGGEASTAVRNDRTSAGPGDGTDAARSEVRHVATSPTAIEGTTRYVSPVTGVWAPGDSNQFQARRRAGQTARRAGHSYRQHSGNDLRAENDSPVVAAIGGRVIYAGKNSGYGWNAVVLGDDGNAFRYATHGPLSVKYGDRVETGQKVGVIGQNHLHFEVIPHGSPLIQQQLQARNTFVPTQWYPGKAAPTLDPAAFFGVDHGAAVTAGKPVGDASKMMLVPEDAPVDPFGVSNFKRPEPQETFPALDAAAYFADGPQAPGTASPVPMLQDPSFLPSPVLSANQTADVQAILAEQGFDPGPIDGVIGPRTRAAAAAFRAAQGFGNYDAVDAGLARALVDTRPPVTPSEPMNRPEDYIRNPNAGRERLPMLRPPGGAMNPPIPRIDPRRPELIDGPMPMPRVNPMRPSRVPEDVPRLNPRRNRDTASVAAFGTPQASPPIRMPLPALRPPRAVEGTEPFGPDLPLRPVPADMLRQRFDDAFAKRPAVAGLPIVQQIPDLAHDVPRTEALAGRFDDAFAPPLPVNGAPPHELVPGLPQPVRSTPELTLRFDDAFATVPGPGGVRLAGGLGAPPPPFAVATLPPGPGAGLNSGPVPTMPPLLSDIVDVPGGPSPIPVRDPFGNLDPNKDQSRLPPYDQINGGEGAYRPGGGKTLDRIADLDNLTAGFDRPELQPWPGLAPLDDGDPDRQPYTGPTQPTRAPQVYGPAPTDIRPQAAGGTGYTNPGVIVAAAPQSAVTPQAAERVWQRVSNIVDSVFNGSGPGGAFNPFNGGPIPPTNYGTPNGFSGAMTSVSGPGPFTGGSNASTYLGSQNWRAPNFNPVSGGSRYPTFTDPASGIGGYVDSQGDVHTYAI